MFKESQAIRFCCVCIHACVCVCVGPQVTLTTRDLGTQARRKNGAADHLALMPRPHEKKGSLPDSQSCLSSDRPITASQMHATAAWNAKGKMSARRGLRPPHTHSCIQHGENPRLWKGNRLCVPMNTPRGTCDPCSSEASTAPRWLPQVPCFSFWG